MPGQQINIRTDKFTKSEIRIIEDCIEEWNYGWIVEIVYAGDSTSENMDVTFILEQEDLGEFLSVIFGCGHEAAFTR